MARKRATAREHHCPRHVGAPPPQLAVDEIGDAAEEKSDCAGGAGDVAEREDGNSAMAGEQGSRQHAAEKTAVERQAAGPGPEEFQGMPGELNGRVEQNGAEAAARD